MRYVILFAIMKKRVILIHGWEGTPDKGWKVWLKEQLEPKGIKVLIPTMPETNTPTLEKWVSHLTSVIGSPDENTFLVGHSLASITILRYLESLQEGQQIGGAIFVAGFGTDLEYDGYNQEVSNFFTTPINWGKVKKRCKHFVAFNSTDDPLVKPKHNKLFEEKLDAKAIMQSNMKHYSESEGIIEVPSILKEVLQMIKA